MLSKRLHSMIVKAHDWITSVRQPPTASAAADQASQFRLSNGFEWTFWRSPVKSCCVSFLTVVRNWGQYDRFAPGDFLLFATRLGFSHLVTSRMFTNYHYSALTTLFYRETFADSRAIDPNHVNDTHKQQELHLLKRIRSHITGVAPALSQHRRPTRSSHRKHHTVWISKRQ